jgi:hypothetical protein
MLAFLGKIFILLYLSGGLLKNSHFGISYPKIFKEIFGDKLLHQYCLFHLNKLIGKDFPRKTTIAQDLLKYKLYNIFYNHEKEIELLTKLEAKERGIIQDKKVYSGWIKKAKNDLYTFVHELELARRRKKVNHEMHSLDKSKVNFDDLFKEGYRPDLCDIHAK